MNVKIRERLAAVDDWETVPGWNKAEQKYHPLDCERWIRENGIREAGRKNGEKEFPPTEATQPDDMYEKILDWVNQRGRQCHAEVSNFLVQQRYNLEQEVKEGMAPIQHEVEGLRDEAKVELKDQGGEDRTILTQKERQARSAWAALEAFQKKANIDDRVAEYGERDTWYWWLVGIVAIEAVANAMMLSGVNEYGLLGAVAIIARDRGCKRRHDGMCDWRRMAAEELGGGVASGARLVDCGGGDYRDGSLESARRSFPGQHACRGNESGGGSNSLGRLVDRRHRRALSDQPRGTRRHAVVGARDDRHRVLHLRGNEMVETRRRVPPATERFIGQRPSITRSTHEKSRFGERN